MITRPANFEILENPFFPVEEQPISLVSSKGTNIKIPGYKAIVDMHDNRVISVVSSKYHLLLNKDAYEMAEYIVREIFDGRTLRDFECYNILMPKTKGSCRIDLIIPNSYKTLSGMKNESWTPFVRISNSYNKTITLKYEIGFCRWICKNGVIFGQKGIKFSMNHLEKLSFDKIKIELIDKARQEFGDINSLWSVFEKKMNTLKSIELPKSNALPIFCKVFDIKEKNTSSIQKYILCNKAKQIKHSRNEYFKELGENAYAMLNVLTDYASFPDWTKSPGNFVDGYQRKVGIWMDNFLTEYRNHSFNFSSYIGGEYLKVGKYLESLAL